MNNYGVLAWLVGLTKLLFYFVDYTAITNNIQISIQTQISTHQARALPHRRETLSDFIYLKTCSLFVLSALVIRVGGVSILKKFQHFPLSFCLNLKQFHDY